jgi:transposase
MTCELEDIIKWLRQCRVDTVAMESTGVYWRPLFNMLCKEGFEVYIVNSKHAREREWKKE